MLETSVEVVANIPRGIDERNRTNLKVSKSSELLPAVVESAEIWFCFIMDNLTARTLPRCANIFPQIPTSMIFHSYGVIRGYVYRSV
jgi:hypothetical protein